MYSHQFHVFFLDIWKFDTECHGEMLLLMMCTPLAVLQLSDFHHCYSFISVKEICNGILAFPIQHFALEKINNKKIPQVTNFLNFLFISKSFLIMRKKAASNVCHLADLGATLSFRLCQK